MRVYEQGRFLRWAVGGPSPAETLPDGSIRATWPCAEDAWAQVWVWRKEIRECGERLTYRVRRITRKALA